MPAAVRSGGPERPLDSVQTKGDDPGELEDGLVRPARPVEALRVEGFKSLRLVEDLRLGQLNVVIGANGSGKSNLVSLFRLLSDIVAGRLQSAIARAGGPDRILHLGSRVTPSFTAFFKFRQNGYGFRLEPTVTNQIFFANEVVYWSGNYWAIPDEQARGSIGAGHFESKLREAFDADQLRSGGSPVSYVYPSVTNWMVYHFHDTSDSAPMKKRQDINDVGRLGPDARNLAPMLLMLRAQHPAIYKLIRTTVRLVAPFFDDFEVAPLLDNPVQTELWWRQTSSDYRLHASQLSDGTLRFVCLATALLQPYPPTTLIIDEPELGLHPYALSLLASLVTQAAARTQVILCTQSASLLDEFGPEDVIVATHENGASRFDRLSTDGLATWLEDYSLGQLWQKNILGGRPSR